MSAVTDLETLIRTRALTDSTLVTLLGGAGAPNLTNIFGPETLPSTEWCVYKVSDNEEMDAFAADGVGIQIEFHLFTKASNGNANCATILDRLRGDAAINSPPVPTYGFHRWNADLATNGSSGWKGGLLIRVGGDTAHERDYLHYVERYQSHAQFQ